MVPVMIQAKADRVVDARNMEPPEPFVHTMEALDAIQHGQKVLLLVAREPFPLYRALELNGFEWQTEHAPDGTVEVLMWHKPK
jgi:tRNA 2-thiouridine synthesizing protein A